MVLNSSALNAQYGAQKRTSYAYKINYFIFLWTRIFLGGDNGCNAFVEKYNRGIMEEQKLCNAYNEFISLQLWEGLDNSDTMK
jgi:hypothetical protein